MSFAPGEVVVSQGDTHADRFYVVEDGELKAEIRGVPGEVCDRLRCGSYFGERALIKVRGEARGGAAAAPLFIISPPPSPPPTSHLQLTIPPPPHLCLTG